MCINMFSEVLKDKGPAISIPYHYEFAYLFHLLICYCKHFILAAHVIISHNHLFRAFQASSVALFHVHH